MLLDLLRVLLTKNLAIFYQVRASLSVRLSLAISMEAEIHRSRILLKLKEVTPSSSYTTERPTLSLTNSSLSLALNRDRRTSSSPRKREVSIMLHRSIRDLQQALMGTED